MKRWCERMIFPGKSHRITGNFIMLCLLVLLFAGCGKEEELPSEKYPTLRVSFLVQQDAPGDLQLVEEALNEITERQIQTDIELIPVRYADFSATYIQMAAEENPLDMMLLPDGASYLSSYISNGMLQPLDDYMDMAGHDLVVRMRKELEAAVFHGKQYAIPQIANTIGASAKGFNLSRSICDELQIDPAAIHTLDDLEAVFAQVREAYPNIDILMPGNKTDPIAEAIIPYIDNLTTGPGILLEKEDGYDIGCFLEEEVVRDALRRVYSWYQKGYIPRNVNTTDQFGSDLLPQGKCFANAVTDIRPEMGGTDYYSVILTDQLPMLTTNSEDMYLWGVSDKCKDPDRAVAFLNLAYRNSYVSNLLRYGISQVHYTTNPNGTLTLQKDSGYSNPWVQIGNVNDICFTDETFEMARRAAGIAIPNQLRIMNNEWQTRYSPAHGFFFDSEKVILEVTACREVDDLYYFLLMNGTVDPDTEIDRCLTDLYNAGMQKVLEEKKKQLQDWLAQN